MTDTDRIAERIAELNHPAPEPAPDPRLDGMPDQLTRDDLAGMTPEQIVAAQEAGQAYTMLGGNQADAELIYLAEQGHPVNQDGIRRLSALNRHDLAAKAAEALLNRNDHTSRTAHRNN
jgi:hypothetical protein